MRKEGQLARAEISEKATRALTGIAMILLGAVLLIPALVILMQAAIMGLIGNGTDPTAAALIVGGAAFLIGMVLGLIGWSWVKPASLVPDKTIDQLKRDAQVPRHSRHHDALWRDWRSKKRTNGGRGGGTWRQKPSGLSARPNRRAHSWSRPWANCARACRRAS